MHDEQANPHNAVVSATGTQSTVGNVSNFKFDLMLALKRVFFHVIQLNSEVFTCLLI